MPLVQIQYSSNLDDQVDFEKLVSRVHETALATGEIKVAALRTMALPVSCYQIADANPQNAFVHVILRMRARDQDKRKAIGDAIFAAVTGHLDDRYESGPLSVSLEIIDIDTWRKNNMHDRLK